MDKRRSKNNNKSKNVSCETFFSYNYECEIVSRETNIMYIPTKIQEIVKDLEYTKDDIGRSKDIVFYYEDKYILKISDNKEEIYKEKEINDWLIQYIPGSKSIVFIEENNKYYYLRTLIKGENLISERILSKPETLINILVDIIDILKSLDDKNCPYNSNTVGNNFVHGDLCLPNILVDEENNFVGFVDLGNAGKGDRWYDYAWMMWSLEYNLHTDKYNKILLNKLNIEFDKEKYQEYTR